MNLVFNTNNFINEVDNNKCLVTLSTCWYILKSKFDSKTYSVWIKNILSIVNNFNLVIYTDIKSLKQIFTLIDVSNNKIKIIIKSFKDFYTYKYKEYWIRNHKNSNLNLHGYTDWKLNMLWNEKVFFVNETISHKYFDTMYYGWCDIGYFRNRKNDLDTKYLSEWPNNNKLLNGYFNNNYIHYGCVENNKITYQNLSNEINNHYSNKLTNQPSLQLEKCCFAGGFFILKRELINIYVNLHDEKLIYYFDNNFVIKDDQTILMDIIFKNPGLFYIHRECMKYFDNWFMFQRLLL